MTRAAFAEFARDTFRRCTELMARKNIDYAEADDVFGNLNACEHLRVCPAEQGILIRMLDKLRRLSSLLRRDAACRDESFEDTCLDIINYAVLLAARRHERQYQSRLTPTKGEPHDNADRLDESLFDADAA